MMKILPFLENDQNFGVSIVCEDLFVSFAQYHVEFNQSSCWLYSVPNLLIFQHLVTLYLGGIIVRVVSEIEC